nr:phosphoserine phosphatase SerB [Cellulomonas taurus]
MNSFPRLVVMDVDSTLITAEVIELLAARAGSLAEVADVTERAMRGELDFTTSLRARVATLAGLPESVFAEVLAEVELTPGAEDLIAALGQRGCAVGLVSGGFIEVVAPLAERLGITRTRANALEVARGHLTGRVAGEVVDRAVKARTLRDWAEADGIDLADTVAIGDGANDLDMLATAGFGVAFNAKPVVAAQADASVDGRLDAVLDLPPFAA